MIGWLLDKYRTARAIAKLERLQVERIAESWNNLGGREEDEGAAAISFDGGMSSTASANDSAISFTMQRLTDERNRARWLSYYSPHGRAIIRTFQKYVLGRHGFTYKTEPLNPDDENAAKFAEEVNAWWAGYVEENDWWLTENEIVERALVDGEVFLRLGLGVGRVPSLTFIDPDFVSSPVGALDAPYGIRFQNGDPNFPTEYAIAGTWVKAQEIYHLKAFARRNMPRGVTLFTASRRLLKLYDDWLDNRAILSKIRTSIALVRKVKAGGTAARELAGKNRTSTVLKGDGTSDAYQRFKPGTIITAPENLDYQFISPALEAADAQYDGVAMLKAASAAVSLAYFMVSADSNDQKYAGTLAAESPALQEIQWWQTFFGLHIEKVWKRLAQSQGFDPNKLKNIRFVLTPPNIQSKDPLLAAQANQIKYANGVTSRRRWAAEDGVSLDEIEKDLEREDLGMPGL